MEWTLGPDISDLGMVVGVELFSRQGLLERGREVPASHGDGE